MVDKKEQEQKSLYTPDEPGQFVGDDLEPGSDEEPHETNTGLSVSWEASEYIHHAKGASWSVVLWVVALVLVAIAVYFQLWTAAALVLVMAFAVNVYAHRQPHIIRYSASDDGVTIGDHKYSFDKFRAFDITEDAGMSSVRLVPAKRFLPAIMIYFADEDGDKIVDILGSHLPMEKTKNDFVDKMSHKLRF